MSQMNYKDIENKLRFLKRAWLNKYQPIKQLKWEDEAGDWWYGIRDVDAWIECSKNKNPSDEPDWLVVMLICNKLYRDIRDGH